MTITSSIPNLEMPPSRLRPYQHQLSQSINFFRKIFDWAGINGASTHSLRRTRLTDLHINHDWPLAEIMNTLAKETTITSTEL